MNGTKFEVRPSHQEVIFYKINFKLSIKYIRRIYILKTSEKPYWQFAYFYWLLDMSEMWVPLSY